MKSEHRHELKTNELADWIAHFPEWAQKNARSLIATAVVIVVVGVAYFLVQYNKNVRVVGERVRFSTTLALLPQTKQAAISNPGQDLSFQLNQVASDLAAYAGKGGNSTMSALAYLKRAEALRSSLHFSLTTMSPEDLAGKISTIQESYSMAEQKATKDPSIRAAACYGKGLCLEELKQFADAEAQYQDILADNTLAGTAGYAAAQYRLQVLPSYQQGVNFRPAPSPSRKPWYRI